MTSLLFAGDVVLLASSKQDLQHADEQTDAKCEVVGMRISRSKAEYMGLSQKGIDCSISSSCFTPSNML